MTIKDIIKRIAYYVSVPKCICCDEILDFDDAALCKSCLEAHKEYKLRYCSACHNEYSACICSNDYLSARYVKKLIKVFRYKPSLSPNEKIPSNELIYQLKRGYRRDIVAFLADEISNAVKSNIKYENFIITNIPRSKSRKHKYGIDHSKAIAKAVAKRLGIRYVEILKSKAKKAQKKTHGDERFQNAAFDYKADYILDGMDVMIFDDIVTTGASMAACAMLVKGLGARRIVGVCVGIAFKDKYIPFDDSDRFYKRK